MERLTFDGNFCDIAQCRYMPCPYDNNCMQKQVWGRLKAYENTGLSPESVEALKLSMMGKATSEITEFNGLPIDRLKELAKADKEGRVLILPCKHDSIVWRLQYVDKGDGTFPIAPVKTRFNLWFLSEFGKTVFLTREEAEKALEARNGNQ